jgi:hypothetical protein
LVSRFNWTLREVRNGAWVLGCVFDSKLEAVAPAASEAICGFAMASFSVMSPEVPRNKYGAVGHGIEPFVRIPAVYQSRCEQVKNGRR